MHGIYHTVPLNLEVAVFAFHAHVPCFRDGSCSFLVVVGVAAEIHDIDENKNHHHEPLEALEELHVVRNCSWDDVVVNGLVNASFFGVL
jgi:hypothetical protein